MSSQPRALSSCTCRGLVGFSFPAPDHFSSLIHKHGGKCQPVTFSSCKGYIIPSTLLFTAIWPLTKPCLCIITIHLPSLASETQCETNIKRALRLLRSDGTKRKRTKPMYLPHLLPLDYSGHTYLLTQLSIIICYIFTHHFHIAIYSFYYFLLNWWSSAITIKQGKLLVHYIFWTYSRVRKKYPNQI